MAAVDGRMRDVDTICDDLIAEHDDLDALVAHLEPAGWDMPTASPGWSIRDQISHLWFFDQKATLALTDAEAFRADAERLIASGGTEASVEPGRAMDPRELLASWRSDRDALLAASRAVDASTRVPWYGPAMGARSFITARLMETWAHGQDVADALGQQRGQTERLRHVAHIGVRARPFSYAVRGLPVPEDDVVVTLNGPDGDVWQWGAPGPNAVVGPALDFCLVVTQRRHLGDTALDVRGAAAEEWMSIAQAFAGPPGPGRTPGQFA
jgi:uncharacterized protein (TIGR03084 family)